jgi:hypothetical protein
MSGCVLRNRLRVANRLKRALARFPDESETPPYFAFLQRKPERVKQPCGAQSRPVDRFGESMAGDRKSPRQRFPERPDSVKPAVRPERFREKTR